MKQKLTVRVQSIRTHSTNVATHYTMAALHDNRKRITQPSEQTKRLNRTNADQQGKPCKITVQEWPSDTCPSLSNCESGRTQWSRMTQLKIRRQDPINIITKRYTVQSNTWPSQTICILPVQNTTTWVWLSGGDKRTYRIDRLVLKRVMSLCSTLTTSSLRISRHQLSRTTAARTSCDLVCA